MAASKRILAPLQFLPAFELVARRLSIKQAAAELYLTPSAVSQQIRALEDALGLSLFHRLTRALALTPAGEQFAQVVSATLDTYRRGTDGLLSRHGRRALRLATEPFIAHELLIPQLSGLRARHAGLDLRIETGPGLIDLARDGVDAAIRYGAGPWPGLTATHLRDAIATAVCAPGFIKGDRVRSPQELARYPLIRVCDLPDPWERMARVLGLKLGGERLVFDSYTASLRAAEKGLGVAIGLFPLTTAAIAEGRLVTPVALRVRTRARWQFVCRKEDANRPELGAVRDWCLGRFAALAALSEDDRVVTLSEPPLRAGAASRHRRRPARDVRTATKTARRA